MQEPAAGKQSSPAPIKTINLALQGGGSHGAFTWGVLDALLEDGRFALEGISGTSAGAVNAVALADGWKRGGADGARQCLSMFWEAIGEQARFSPLQRSVFDVWLGNYGYENSPSYRLFDMWSRMFSPYEFNPLDMNPLRDVLEANVDLDKVNHCDAFHLFISATNVLTGKGRVFRRGEITIDAVLASACLPNLFKAVEIDGVPHWDGGYAGNPVLYPFFYETDCADVLLVQINPVARSEAPRTAWAIQDRVNEITFNAGLLREFRAIEFVRRLKLGGRLEGTEYRDIRMHRIAGDPILSKFSASSKMNAEPGFLLDLKEAGRAAARDFLDRYFDDIGKRATLDLTEELRADLLPGLGREPIGQRMRSYLDRLTKVGT